jgi:hypothetical protein
MEGGSFFLQNTKSIKAGCSTVFQPLLIKSIQSAFHILTHEKNTTTGLFYTFMF